MQIAIIGAGVAGLAAARRLRQRRPGLQVTVYEQGRALGGRLATGRRDGFAFDHGAQVLKAPGDEIARLLTEELPAGDLRQIERPVWVFDGAGAIAPGDPALNAEVSFYYRDGNDRLAALLANGLDVRRETRVAALRRSTAAQGGRWSLIDAAGQAVCEADAVLLTPPAPQAAEILAASNLPAAAGDALLGALRPAAYRRCISLALAFARPLDRPFYALVNTDRAHPIAWLALEHTKGRDRCPAGHSLLVAQMAPQWSLDHWEQPTEALTPAVGGLLDALLGESLGAPLWCDRRDWRDALPAGGADEGALGAASGGLFFAGDYTAGQGRAHLAIESGWRAADAILNS